MRHKFLVLTVKKWLKSVYIYGSYRKIKTGVPLFLDHSVRDNIGGDIPIDVPPNQNIGGDVSPASPAALTPVSADVLFTLTSPHCFTHANRSDRLPLNGRRRHRHGNWERSERLISINRMYADMLL